MGGRGRSSENNKKGAWFSSSYLTVRYLISYPLLVGSVLVMSGCTCMHLYTTIFSLLLLL